MARVWLSDHCVRCMDVYPSQYALEHVIPSNRTDVHRNHHRVASSLWRVPEPGSLCRCSSHRFGSGVLAGCEKLTLPDPPRIDSEFTGSWGLPDRRVAMKYDIVWQREPSDVSAETWTRCFAPPRLGLFWFRALEAARLEDQFTFFYGLLQRDGLDVGIVPAFVFALPLELVVPRGAARMLGLIARGRFSALRQ